MNIRRFSLRGIWRALGPGLVTGGADDATLGGSALLVTNIDPIAMLFWTAVINGIVAVPVMIATMLVVSNKREARKVPLPRWLLILGWLAAALMALAVGLLIWSSL